MTPITTAQEALELLERAVATKGPDFVYRKRVYSSDTRRVCVYVHEGQPDCLIGVALHLAGWTLEELSDVNSTVVTGLPSYARLSERLSSEAALVLQAAQDQQDLGKTWGAALKAARARASTT